MVANLSEWWLFYLSGGQCRPLWAHPCVVFIHLTQMQLTSVANVDGSDKENDDDNNNQKSGEVPEDIGEEDTESEAQQSGIVNERMVCEQWPAEKLTLF